MNPNDYFEKQLRDLAPLGGKATDNIISNYLSDFAKHMYSDVKQFYDKAFTDVALADSLAQTCTIREVSERLELTYTQARTRLMQCPFAVADKTVRPYLFSINDSYHVAMGAGKLATV